jgi:hypothetical protein
MRKTLTILVLATLMVSAPLIAADSTRWLNVHVTELEDGTNVEVHLPLTMVLSLIKAVNVEQFHGGKVDLELDDAEIDWPEVLRAIKDAPDGEFVKVDAPDANVVVSKTAGTITIDVNAMDEEAPALVKVRLPATVIDSLAIDENNQMDVAALLSSFESLPNGDLVTVDAPDAKVRVWIE